MANILRLLDRWIEEAVIVVLGSIMVLALTYAACVRYFTTNSFLVNLSTKAEEVAVFCFVFFLYFGASLATREGKHFRVTAQFSLLPKSWQKWRFVVGDTLWLCFCFFVVWQGIELVSQTMLRSEPSISLQIPMQYIYAVLPFSFGLTAFRLIQTYFRGTQGREEGDELTGIEEPK